MKFKLNIVFLLLFITAFELNAFAGMKSYLVAFEEEFYKDNQLYQARVMVYLNNKRLGTEKEIRGSTLPNRFLYYMDKNRPVVASGEHRFDIVSCAKFGKALRLNHGGYVQTMNPNPIKHGDRLATGIWIHKGKSSGPVKGSHGCLTIAPQNWKEFIKLFPGPKEWKKMNYQGKTTIIRNSKKASNRPDSPSNFRILRHTLD